MIERRLVRVLVPYNKTLYFLDKGASQHGISHDLMMEFEKNLNREHRHKHKRILVVFIPTDRDKLIDRLLSGEGDIIAANLTITPEREKIVDFTTPLATDVSEIVVTGPNSPTITSLDDLAGQSVFVNPQSSYAQSLETLNKDFKGRGLAPIKILAAPANFETEDALEMVQAGLMGVTIADDYLARFWEKTFPTLKLHPDLAIRQHASVAFAIRKDSPQLKQALDQFFAKHGRGSLFGNDVLHRYLKSGTWVKRAADPQELDKMIRHAPTFQKYSDRYNMNWRLMLAQGYQESGLNQSAKSAVGAIGVMQLMPQTGAELRVGNIHVADNNIHGGVKYMRQLIDAHFKDEDMNDLGKGLFALAAYNAGPGRIHRLREEAKKEGLDPNKWFNNVEIIVAKRVGRETTQYVSNIYKYYLVFDLLQNIDSPASDEKSTTIESADKSMPSDQAK